MSHSLTLRRKHTGERPFQCHCSRRFSRLDNLRQHAQTVHVNEEIPGDSLAATSTRFQRQIRTDRVKSSGGRSRTTAQPGAAPHARGHTRNLSTSSIGSTSSFGVAEETRPRPPPLAIATGAKRSSGVMEDYSHVDGARPPYFSQSGIGTPTSQYTPGYASPTSAISRSSFYGSARHSRRLSVPSGPNAYQHPMHPAAYYTPVSSHASVYSSASGYASPTSSVYSHDRRDSEIEIESRRRTWHPSTQSTYSQRPATSGLSYHQTPDEPLPAMSQQPAATQVTRLPGIESFDHVAQTSAPSPMMLDARPSTSDRPFDAGLQQGFHKLEIAPPQAPSSDSYQHPSSATQVYTPQSYLSNASPRQPRHQHHLSMPEVPITPRKNKRQAWYGGPIGQSTALQPPLPSYRPSPEDSGSSDGISTPFFSGQEYHPAIANQEANPAHLISNDEQEKSYASAPRTLHPLPQSQEYPQKPAVPVRADSGFQGYAPPQHGPITAQRPLDNNMQYSQYSRYPGSNVDSQAANLKNDMGRLEALVAVATSETRAAENQR